MQWSPKFRVFILAVVAPWLLFNALDASACDFCVVSQGIQPELTTRSRSVTLSVNSVESDHVYDHAQNIDSDGKQEQWLTYSLTAFAPVTDDWTVQFTLPYVVKTNVDFDDVSGLNPGVVTSGVGDIAITARYRLFQKHGFDSTWILGLLGGIKLPTGATGARDHAGEPVDRHALPGTGSWDFDLGFTGAYTIASGLKLTLDGVYRIATTGKWADRDHRFGNSFNYSLKSFYRVAETDSGADFSPFVGIAGDTTGKERGAEDPSTGDYSPGIDNLSTGGTVLFAQLGLYSDLSSSTIINLGLSKAFYRDMNFNPAFEADPVENYKIDVSVTYLF